MQYYGLILNRTYFVSVDAQGLTCTVCRGLTAVKTPFNSSSLAVRGDLHDPASYITYPLTRRSRANFTLSHGEITSVVHDPRKKWGMGYYPHDGRVFVDTVGRRYEFIILGNQSGREIAERLSAYLGHVPPGRRPD
jgi:hypothetical protein